MNPSHIILRKWEVDYYLRPAMTEAIRTWTARKDRKKRRILRLANHLNRLQRFKQGLPWWRRWFAYRIDMLSYEHEFSRMAETMSLNREAPEYIEQSAALLLAADDAKASSEFSVPVDLWLRYMKETPE